MRLVEFFTLLELRDRLSHIAETMAKKIAKRWDDKVNDGGMTGLPSEWRQALSDDIIPDAMTMSRHENWSEIYGQKMARWVVEWFSQADPTKNKKYTDWILRQWLSDTLWLEDVAKIPDMLVTFEEHRKKLPKMDIVDREGNPMGPPPQRRSDINSWKDYRELAYAVRPLSGTRAAGDKVANMLAKPDIQAMMHHPVPDPQKAFGPEGEWDLDEIRSAYAGETGEDGGQFDTMDWYDFEKPDAEVDTTAIEKVYADDKIAVLIPNSRAAACELGKGTEWCTAATTAENYFWHYAPDDPLYVVLTDKHGKFQFHFESNQFKDVHDDELTDKQKAELTQEYPQLYKIFNEKARKNDDLWLIDPDTMDVGFIHELIEEAGTWENPKHMLREIPKMFDGRIDEEALQLAEEWMRRNDPLDAFRFIRQPTDQDFQASMNAYDPHSAGYEPSSNIMWVIKDNDLDVSDETLEMALTRDGKNIWHIKPERLIQNPEWVLAAVQNQPVVLEKALRDVRSAEPVKKEVNETIIAILREQSASVAGKRAMMRVLPYVSRQMMSYWFGVELFIYTMNRDAKFESLDMNELSKDLQQIPASAEGWNWDAILQWFIQNPNYAAQVDQGLVGHLHEVYNGRLPEQFVAVLPEEYQRQLGAIL